MELTGSVRIAAPREAVWAALNDPVVLERCIPGCDGMEREGDDAFTARVAAKVGPVSAKFSGKVTLRDIDRPNGYTLAGEGTGGVAGFGKGEAQVALTEEDGVTVVSYTATGTVGGKLAQVGSRLVDGAARKIADAFFNRFAAEFEPPTAAESDGETGVEIGGGGAAP